MSRGWKVAALLVLGFLACDSPESPSPTGTGGLALTILPAGGGVPFDSGYVIVRGPTDTTVKATPGQPVTVNNLKPGAYTVGLEGFAGGTVSSFGQFSVTIVAGQTAHPTVSLQLFGTVIDSMPSYTTDGQFRVFFAKVPIAASYVVQKDAQVTFATAQETAVTDTSAQLSIPATGPYFVRVVAVDAYGKRGSPSAARQITTLTQVLVTPGGATISTASGTQTFTATGKDPQGNVINNVPFTWTSVNSNVASVAAATGLATAVATGQSAIVATLSSVSGSALLTVAAPPTTAVNVWSAMTNSAGTNYLWTVWGTSVSNVFAVGNNGTIMRFNGTSWSLMTNPAGSNAIRGVWGTSGSDVFAVGAGGTILHFNGSTWSAMTSNTTSILYSVWGTAQGNVFAVGSTGTIMRFDGTSWSAMTQTMTTQQLTSIWGTSANNVFAVGFGNTVVRFDGTAWSPMSSPTPAATQLYRVWGTGPNDVFAVGSGGVIVHFNGTAWSTMTSGTTQDLIGVWGTSSSEVFASGAGGTILMFNGSAWSALNSGQALGTDVWSTWGTSANNLFAVGFPGLALRGVRGAPVQKFGNATDLGGTVTFTAGYLMGPTLTITSKIELTDFGLISKGAASQVKMALYTDVGGSPGQLVAQVAGSMCTAVCEYGAPQTQVLPGTYWIVAIYDVATAVAADNASTNVRKFNIQPFTDPLPTTFPPATAATGQNYNYYVKGYVVP